MKELAAAENRYASDEISRLRFASSTTGRTWSRIARSGAVTHKVEVGRGARILYATVYLVKESLCARARIHMHPESAYSAISLIASAKRAKTIFDPI